MDEEHQFEISYEGGKASHEQGTGHAFTSEEARDPGRRVAKQALVIASQDTQQQKSPAINGALSIYRPRES